jgi:hypothetical protein
MFNKGLDADGLLHPSTSNDGINFTARATYNTYTTHASSGLAGDPTLLNYNGKMYVSLSPGVGFTFTNNTLEIASSTDGDTWTYLCSPDFTAILGGAYNEVWNDSWFVDVSGLPYMFIDRNQTSNHLQQDVWLVQATSSDLSTWGTPAKVTGTGFPSSIQSVFVVLSGGTYYLFYKNNVSGQQYIELATNSVFAATGWTVIKTGDWAGWGSPRETPWIVPKPGNASEYRIYLDKDGAGYVYSDSTGGLTGTWSAPAAVSCDFGTPQHGSVVLNLTGH